MTKHVLQTVLLFGILLTTSLIALGQVAAKPTPKSPDAVAAVKAYEAAEAKAKADYEKAVATARAAAIKSLTAAMEKATKAGNLDEAVAIREKIAALKAEEEAGQVDPRVATIVGTWKEPNGTPWTFTADGRWVATKYNVYGTWTLTATSLRVVFGNNNIGKNRVDVYTDFTDGTISGKSSVGHEMRLIKDTAKQ